MKNKIIAAFLGFMLILSGCGGREEQNVQAEEEQTSTVIQENNAQDSGEIGMEEKTLTRAVFVWYGIEKEDLQLFEKYSINTVLLDSEHMDDISLLDGYRVYILTGEPDWETEEMKAAAEEAEKVGADGIIFDIEDSYSKLALNLEDLNITFPVYCCIPFWLDPMTADETMSDMTGMEITERIIKATDGVFVMNYLKENERMQISTEMEMCRRYNKELVTIYELQPAGIYDLKDCNTYNKDGLDAVKENYEKMFGGTDVGIAYHNLAMMRELNSIASL